MKPRYFASPAEWRAWLQANHNMRDELWVGYHKKATGKPSMTWSESVDQALCFGWIDGIRKRVDANRYVIRFTPRRPGSLWSAVNRAKVAVLTRKKLMRPAGLKAYEIRTDQTSQYSYEQRRNASLDPAYLKKLKANPAAWKYFQSRAPRYQHLATWWILSAKKEETRLRRLDSLIEQCAAGRPFGVLSSE